MSAYTVFVMAQARRELKDLPGNMRHRVRTAIDKMAENPRPARSKRLDVPDLAVEARRVRLDAWRIVYAILEADKLVDVLAVRKRPPYDYGDLLELLTDYPT